MQCSGGVVGSVSVTRQHRTHLLSVICEQRWFLLNGDLEAWYCLVLGLQSRRWYLGGSPPLQSTRLCGSGAVGPR